VSSAEAQSRRYIARLRLGVVTDTQDTTGRVLSQTEQHVSRAELEAALEAFRGEILQTPPMYSALKVDGKKLYELAREGKVSERKARPVKIHEIVIESVNLPEVVMSVSCSKGTYIRTLCNDIGAKLGVGGCMKDLLRTKVGRFLLEDTLKLSDLQKLKAEGRLAEAVYPLEEVFADCPEIRATDEVLDKLVKNGNPFRLKGTGTISDGDSYKVYSMDGQFLGIYEYKEEKGMLYPKKMFL
jgi:tRNA pseudouridine55 synthase